MNIKNKNKYNVIKKNKLFEKFNKLIYSINKIYNNYNKIIIKEKKLKIYKILVNFKFVERFKRI
jgi:hypothetical protein